MWEKIKAQFRDSATIAVARFHYVIGVLGAALIAKFSDYDFTQLVSMDWKAAFKMLSCAALSGVVVEIARRRTL